jgi:hypothetical protein
LTELLYREAKWWGGYPIAEFYGLFIEKKERMQQDMAAP